MEKYKDFELSDDLLTKLKSELKDDKSNCNNFIINKYEKEASKNWDIFYKRNKDNFYKNRNYLDKEIPLDELLLQYPNRKINLLEIGCGVGNSILPLLEKYNNRINFYAFDFSKTAVTILKDNKLYNEDYVKAEVCDIVNEDIPFFNECPKFDIITSVFVLSAISPENHSKVFLKIKERLDNNGVFYFRDYAKYDLAELKLSKKNDNKLDNDFYLKTDGTRVYYFTKEYLDSLLSDINFNKKDLKYIHRLVENIKLEKKMYRIWIHGLIYNN